MLHCIEPTGFGNAHKDFVTMTLPLILAKVRAYLRYRESVRELAQLSDRELADIGLSRGDIPQAARSVAA